MKLTITEKLWRYPGEAAWYFIRLDKESSHQVKEGAPKRGWGSVKVQVKVGATTWNTSIFPEKDGSYLLPVKASVRKAEGLNNETMVTAQLTVV